MTSDHLTNDKNMRIIFLRHGKAEEHGIKEDHLRALTEEGKKALITYLPSLADYLHDKSPRVCSSSLVRAYDTAKILLSSLDKRDPVIYSFIADGNSDALREAIQQASGETMVIVGHEPYISAWIRELTGTFVYVRKGDAIEISYNSTTHKGYLRWQCRLNTFHAIKKRSEQHVDLILESTIHRLMDAIEEQRAAFIADYKLPENVHQLRIAIRKMRTLLSLLKSALPPQHYNRIRGRLRTMQSATAELREIDVFSEEVRKQKSKCAKGEYPLFLDYLEAARLTAAVRLYRNVKRSTFKNSLDIIRHTMLQYLDIAVIIENDPKYFIEHKINRWAKTLQRHSVQLVTMPLEEIHEMRLKAKKARYLSEIFASYVSAKYKKTQKRSTTLQNAIGQICDCQRNITIAGEIMERNSESPLLTEEIMRFIQKERTLEKKRRTQLQKRI